MKTLTLTTPEMRGPAVSQLQTLLMKKGYLVGERDGVYGVVTAQAVYRAKYWLGYRKPDQVAGDALMGFLRGTAKRSRTMRFYAARRRRLKAVVPKRVYLYREAVKHIGVKESPPGSNRVLFSLWYGMNGPWCAMFCSFCANRVGIKFRYAYCPFVVHDARAGRNGLSITNMPQQGDLVLYDWGKDGVADHIGIFEKWHNSQSFTAIEGNTSLGNDSNGGAVMRRDRTRSSVQAFVHISG